MTRLGIVGAGADKFTPSTEATARAVIDQAIVLHTPTHILSGHSPLGGIDIWAEEAARTHGIPTIIYAPEVQSWHGHMGFKERNLRIANESDLLLCIVAAEYPPGYTGRRFNKCYHCLNRNPPHVKSGGCWTAWKANRRAWVIIPGDSP